MKPSGDLDAFTLTALDLLGGAAEQRSAGLYTVLWPVSGAGHLETRQLAFDPDLLDEQPASELVTFGSAALEELVLRATASGRVAEAFLNAPIGHSRTIADRLLRSYRFRNGVWTAEGFQSWWLPSGIFVFRVRYLSDTREEDLFDVALNLADGRILRRLDTAIEHHGMTIDPSEAWPMMAELPMREAYAIARGELEQRLIAPLGLRRRELAARLTRESERATAYYDELLREGEEQHTAQAADALERARVESRLAALEIERTGRLAELRNKYRLEAEVSLRSLLRLYLPRVVVGGKITGKSASAALALIWDPLEESGEPVRCAQCHRLTYELGVHRSGSVFCNGCLDAPLQRV